MHLSIDADNLEDEREREFSSTLIDTENNRSNDDESLKYSSLSIDRGYLLMRYLDVSQPCYTSEKYV